jgi:hypothetical protein
MLLLQRAKITLKVSLGMRIRPKAEITSAWCENFVANFPNTARNRAGVSATYTVGALPRAATTR